MLRLFLTVIFATSAAALSAVQPSDSAYQRDPQAFETRAVEFFRQYCLACHGPEASEGDLRVDQDLGPAFDDMAIAGRWNEVVNVLNSHEMPPQGEPQPKATEVAELVDWITAEMIRVEQSRGGSAVIIRRLNRAEYQNTIRDLVGVDFSTDYFPEDPATGGFDNNGGALTISPLHLEIYYNAARDILDSAMVEGPRPPTIRWRFEPESGNSDSNRVAYDGQRLIVNANQNRVEGGRIAMHHNSWDRTFNVRDFTVKAPGKYIVRVRAGGIVPTRQQVIDSARIFLDQRLEEARQKQPDQLKWEIQGHQRSLKHFESSAIYDYGPPRLRITQHLAGQPKVIAEFDVQGSPDSMETLEFEADFTNEKAGLTIEYAYDIPRELENFWMQQRDDFARPEAWIDWMEIEGPIYPQWPPESQTRLFFDSAKRKNDELAYVRDVLTRFMQRAYRRRVEPAEVDRKLALYLGVRKEAETMERAIITPLTAILVSPSFLYLAEPMADAGDNSPSPINDFELASRLSYFLWSSMPDDALFGSAARGDLHQPSVLRAQVDRMLADPKSDSFVKNFAGQWLGLREVGNNPPAPDLYRNYDRHLETSMVEESLAFFREILRNDLSMMNFIDSDFVVINERVARFYGIQGIDGDHFRRVSLPDHIHRGGVLTHASILSITSNGTRTSPVKRGTWVLKNILGTDPGLPVANAGEIAPKVPGIDKATVRQRLEIHRELPQCARCHSKIDPLGFALENFDASGRWREREGHGYQGRINDDDPLIDASSKLPDGTEIEGIESLQAALLAKEDLFLKCLTEKMYTYGLGRTLSIVDRPQIQSTVAEIRQSGFTLRSLIHSVIQSPQFNTK